MDKNKLKTFAIESRRQLIEDTTYQANLLGISAEKIQDPIEEAEGMQAFNIGGTKPYIIYDEDIEKRNNLVKEVTEKGFENVIEEVAYTWFNRIIAIRYMEVNNYLPTRIRVLSSETPGKTEPDIIKEAPHIDLNLTQEDIQTIYKLKEENKNDELFQFLFIKQCNKLNEILPGLFQKTEDYMELLLNINYISKEGIIEKLVNNIPEEDFTNQVEIIGWLYQYYNTELKEDTYKNIKKNKVPKNRIPSVTQLFTPDWIVKYMVENSLGRLWLNGHPNKELEDKWEYYLTEPEQDKNTEEKLKRISEDFKNINPLDIKIIDPSMGSGHILVYVFDLLIDIYTSMGYSKKDAAINILKNNIYGLDIDTRAYQLAYFSIMMKARSYNSRILTLNIIPQILSFHESSVINEDLLELFKKESLEVYNDLKYLIKIFENAKTLGSIIKVNEINIKQLKETISVIKTKNNSNIISYYYKNQLKEIEFIIKQAEFLCQKYNLVITNPPYMGKSNMTSYLSTYVKNNYPNSNNDLFSVFIEKGFDMIKENMFNCMVTMQSWMFLSSFEKFRKTITDNYLISNLLHMNNMVMGIAFGTSATIFRKTKLYTYNGNYNQIKFKDINENDIPFEFPVKKNINTHANFEEFKQIPGSPIAYWITKEAVKNFKKGFSIDKISEFTGSQNKTANNNKFLRYTWEINKHDLGNKWIIYAKGGDYRRYYGNLNLVVDWSENARNFYLKNKTSNLLNEKYWYKEGITYNKISTKGNTFRYLPKGCVFDMGGPSICSLNDKLYYILGLFNSTVITYYLNILNPTINIQAKDIKALPIIYDSDFLEEINLLVSENILISKEDWDSYETSIDFEKNPLIKKNCNLIEKSFKNYENDTIKQYNTLKNNQESINKIFLKIYDLNNYLNFEVDENEINFRTTDLHENIIQLISYGVGCIFGRYSLDNEGLVSAGNEINLSDYSSFIPDEDNIVPVLDSEYFDDDIVGRFVEFVRAAFGSETLEENLDFIANALNNKGSTSREVIRNYLLTDFFKDHIKMYKKCPIYWQFDSGKENSFKCLIYMHRYTPDLVARVRTDYLHKTQKAIESQINYQQNIKENSSNSKDQARADKHIKKLTKQLDETRRYDEALAHVASQNIEIDLDDGVKVNYAKFQNVEVSKEGQKVKKINLLKKI